MRLEPTINTLSPFDWENTWGYAESTTLPISAYFHVPFCRHRCGYCNFSLIADRDDLVDRYLDAVQSELSRLRIPRPVQTVFIGGGTPSLLSDSQTERLLCAIRFWLPTDSNCEYSIEANPLDINAKKCELWSALGVNRLSIGGQSFQPSKLSRLERDHSSFQLLESIGTALRYFRSVSLDLIFACPDESCSEWNDDLSKAIESGVQHISTYGLTFEKGAAFWGMRQRGVLKSVDEDLELEMYSLAIDRLTSSGFKHYEISNFAKPGFECKHNESYWFGRSWWAFGPSAARFVGGARSVNHRGTLQYMRRIEQNQSPIMELDVLSPDQIIRERLVFGMRRIDGVSWSELTHGATASLIADLQENIESHIRGGWMIREGDRIRLTKQGLFVSDSLWKDYL